jgi:hypothetical protein
MKLAGIVLMAAVAASGGSLDFEAYRAKVEPIFLKQRPGHARCVVCHSTNSSAFHLQPLEEGKKTWTLEQSRENFASVSDLVVPGKPKESRLLLHPLAAEGGGDKFHGGGQQFKSQDDPDWKTIAAWVESAK